MNGRAFTPKRTHDWEAVVAGIAFVTMVGKSILTEDVSLKLTFHRNGKRRADLDNLIKAVKDAMNSIVYQDDNLVTKLQAEVIYNSLKPGVQIEVQYA